MIATGVSPTEAAFEVVGLVNAKSIIDFLLKRIPIDNDTGLEYIIFSLSKSTQGG